MVYNYIPNKAALVTYNQQYVCAESGGGRELVANRETPAAWETFDLELIDSRRWLHNGFRSGSQIALKASNGNYVCADGNQNWSLYANRTTRGPWETFFIEDMDGYSEIHSGSRIALKAANGKYVCAEGGGGNGLIANRGTPAEWETFVLELLWMIRPLPVLYRDQNYQGNPQGLHPGLYDHPLRIGNDVVSSLRVPQGSRVVLYEHEHFAGGSKLCLQDFATFSDFNDITSSVRVGNLLVGSNYTDLGCNESGNFDYYWVGRPKTEWEPILRSHVTRGLDKLKQYGVKQVRVWVVPPQVGLLDVERTFMPARIGVIAYEAKLRGMIVTVDLHDFGSYREPNPSPSAGRDQLLTERIDAIVMPNSSFSNLRWSIGNEIRGPDNPEGFATWYENQANKLTNAVGPGQLIVAEMVPGAAEHHWGGDTTVAAKRIIAVSDIVSIHFYPECDNPDLERNSMKEWQKLCGDKFRIGEFSINKDTPNRSQAIRDELKKFEVMGRRGVHTVSMWQFLKTEQAGHIDPLSLEVAPGMPYNGEIIAGDLADRGWLRRA